MSRQKSPSAEGDWLVIEVKARKKLPQWIKVVLTEARIKATPFQLGIVVLGEVGDHDSLVVMNLQDFKDWFGGVKDGADGPNRNKESS